MSVELDNLAGLQQSQAGRKSCRTLADLLENSGINAVDFCRTFIAQDTFFLSFFSDRQHG